MNAVPAVRDAGAGASEALALAFLADLSQALAVSLDLRQTLTEAITRIASFMQAEAASLFLLDPHEPMLECRVCVGPVDLKGVRIAVGQGAVGRAVAENTSIVVDEASGDPRFDATIDATSGFDTRSVLCAPLSTARGPIGALEVVNKRGGGTFSAHEARILRLIAAPTALAINNARMAQELVEQTRMRREFDLARRLQKSLLPQRRRDGFPVRGVNLPANEISGDFYDFFDLPGRRVGFVIGDVSGKGLDAALLMVRAAALLRWVGKDDLAPGQWLARVNDELCETRSQGRFVCALVGDCDRDGGNARIAGAGFPPALLHRDGRFEAFPSGGPPLGILSGQVYDEHVVEIGDGALYCFSDGVTDVRDAQRRTIGAQGVRDLVATHAGASPEPRLRALVAALKHLRLVDDTTVLLIERPRARGPEILLERCFAADPCELREMRSVLRGTLDDAGVDTALRDKLVLAVDEACCNVIRHAYGPQRTGDIALRVASEGDVLEFRLVDSAPPVEPGCVCPKPLGEVRAGGLGVALIDSVMDDWRIAALPGGDGNCLTMRKRVARNEPGDDE